ncbi:MAG: sigma-54 dependent transcriptional regulator [Desulfocapsa sp.]|nr:sigma-54 dependent transcriptional regulator [Desulfocapsa sp.]
MAKTLYPSLPVLLVDDENAWLNSFGLTLQVSGINNVMTCNDSRKVMDLLQANDVSVLVLDLTMPHLAGKELLPQVVEAFPEIPVIIITGLDQVETAVACMKLGAYDFYTKVTEESRLVTGVKRAIDFGLLRRENSSLKEHFLQDKLNNPDVFSHIITHNKSMRSVFQYIEAIACTCEPVLITGETGVGKELFAQAIHYLSGRSGNFVEVNIAGLDSTLLADTLFGHKKGAFSGADQNRKGVIAQAADGSLFLDEICGLTPVSQIKLLRLIQDREYYALGSDVALKTNARVIVSSHLGLDSLQESSEFRKDLFFRLRSHHVHIPPLRERLDDLPLLLDYFLGEAAVRLNKTKPSYPSELPILLGTYSYPGNVRELQSMVFDALSKHKSRTLSMGVFKEYIESRAGDSDETVEDVTGETVFSILGSLPTLKASSRLLVKEALNRSQGNQAIAAQMLGITRQALNWRLKQQPGKK